MAPANKTLLGTPGGLAHAHHANPSIESLLCAVIDLSRLVIYKWDVHYRKRLEGPIHGSMHIAV